MATGSAPPGESDEQVAAMNPAPETPDAGGPPRLRVRGPQNPPTAEEALLDPRRGYVRRGGSRSSVGDEAVLRLISQKLRLALRIGVGFFILLVLVYLGLALSTDGGPLAWLVPGLVIYPLIIGAGWFYLRRILAYDRAYLESQDAGGSG